ncbi:unnamed protein product, partial [Polarella glacialis]
NSSDCPKASPLAAQRACYGVAGCLWLTSEWASCSSQCGNGTHSRQVTCSSGAAVDCVPGSRPTTSEGCYEVAGCRWSVGPWASECSETCGDGLLTRQVSCPSGQPLDCSASGGVVVPQPAQWQSCRGTSGCSWLLSAWSACSASCGDGSRARSVSCSSGSDADCGTNSSSATSETCHDTSGCSWTVGAWSTCNSTCGPGQQQRSVSCPAGSAAGCPGSGPETAQACLGHSGCSWSVGAWGECSSSCGQGVLSRTVSCPSGTDLDCGSSRPASSELCSAVGGCQWQVSDWSTCSEPCSVGTVSRSVSCPSGVFADCGLAAPESSEPCNGSSTDCSWATTLWSACSSDCGDGQQLRSVLCAGLQESQCPGELRPQAARSCSSTEGCNWALGAWSNCSASCGGGQQARIVSCPSGRTLDCLQLQPAAEQVCHETWGCAWQVSSWGKCSSSCGPGTSSRSVACSAGASGDCAHLPKPPDQQPCLGDEVAGCVWTTGEWGACKLSGDSCDAVGAARRDVLCPSVAGAVGCAGAAPSASRFCASEVPCPWKATVWSECNCGAQQQVRNVSCPGGQYVPCVGEEPAATQPCLSTADCGWEVDSWSSCSSICGAGLQIRDVRCLTTGSCGASSGPSRTRDCWGSSGCEWQTAAWNDCSSQCGEGLQLRDVRCSSGRLEDCAGLAQDDAKPSNQSACHSTANCSWAMSPWSLCSSSCGRGSRTRSVRCPSGAASDCGRQVPATVEVCEERAGCAWQTSDWRSCSAICGEGAQLRDVWCPLEGGCPGLKPTESKACQSQDGCGWEVGNWTQCSASCGEGAQSRSAECATPGA